MLLGADGLSGQDSPGGVGILLAGGGKVVNSGVVRGGAAGNSQAYGGAGVLLQEMGTVSNSGTIFGGGYSGLGVDLVQGGALTNHGAINGGVALGAPGTVQNSGTISGGAPQSFVYSIYFSAGGTLINHGTVGGYDGYSGGVLFNGQGQIDNFGVIQGGYTSGYSGPGNRGVSISGGGTLTNHGTIAGGFGGEGGHYRGGDGGDAVYLDGGTLIAASGTLEGGLPGGGTPKGKPGDAVRFGSVASTLVVDPGAQFVGNIQASAAGDTLVLSGSTAGTLSGFGKTVTGFTKIEESANATWALEGKVTGAGTLSMGSASHLEISGASITTIQFLNGAQNLQLDSPKAVTSTFAGFGAGDSIDLMVIKATSLQYANGTLTLLDANGTDVDKLAFSGTYTAADFSLHSITNGTELDYVGAAQSYRGPPEGMVGHASLFRDDSLGFVHDWHAVVARE
jgi:hypothetical protein